MPRLAKEQGIEMTDKHWEVVELHATINTQSEEAALSIRGIKKSGVIDIKAVLWIISRRAS